MMLHFLRFELRYWLRGMMVWVLLVIVGALFFGAASTDKVQVGRALENTFRNAPYFIQTFHAMASILTMLMVTAFVNSAAARDFQHNTYQIHRHKHSERRVGKIQTLALRNPNIESRQDGAQGKTQTCKNQHQAKKFYDVVGMLERFRQKQRQRQKR